MTKVGQVTELRLLRTDRFWRLFAALVACVNLFFAFPRISMATDEQRSVDVVVANFSKLSGAPRFDRLESSLPDAVHVALLPYQAINPVPHGKLWRALAERRRALAGLAPEGISPRRIFEQDILNIIQPDYVLWGEFAELSGIIEFSGVIEDLASDILVEIAPIQIDESRLLAGVSLFTHNVVESLNEIEQLGYGVRRLGVLCFDDDSPASSPDTEWIGRDLVRSLPSLIGVLPGAKITNLDANNDDCDDSATMIPVAITEGFDALIGGSYRLDGDELTVAPVVFVTDKWAAVPMPGFVARQDGYLRQKLALAESVRDLFAGILRPTGEWNISEELARMDVQPEEYLARGRELLQAGDERLALVLLDRVLTAGTEEEAAEAHYLKGHALLAQQRYREAAATFEAALETRPNFAMAFVGLGDALFEMGRRNEARDAYVNALDHSLSADTYKKLGNVHLLAHQFDEARDAYGSAIAMDPTDPESYYLMGAAYSRERSAGIAEREENEDVAIHWFERALAIDPAFEPARVHLAQVFRERGFAALYRENYKQAFESFQNEIQTARTPDALFYSALSLTMVLVEQGDQDYSEAIVVYEHAISEGKNQGDDHASFVNAYAAYLNLAELQLVNGNYKAAAELASEALDRFNNTSMVKGVGGYLTVVTKILAGERYEDELEQLESDLESGEGSVDTWSFELLENSISQDSSVSPREKELIFSITEKFRAQ